MCAYKLVTIKFKWWGLQNKVENFIQKVSASPLLGCRWRGGIDGRQVGGQAGWFCADVGFLEEKR